MLTIRSDHLNGFREGANPGLCERFSQSLTTTFPHLTQTFPPKLLKQFCYDGINCAVSLNFRSEKNVYIFVAAMLVFGKDFDANEKETWCQDVLRPKPLHEDLASLLLELRIFMQTGIQV